MNRLGIIVGLLLLVALVAVSVFWLPEAKKSVPAPTRRADPRSEADSAEQLEKATGQLPRLPTTQEQAAAFDPGNDTWKSELFSERAVKQLAALADRMSHRAELNSQAFKELLTSEFQTRRLRPEPLTVVYADGGIEVRRPRDSRDEDAGAVALPFVEAVAELLAPSGLSPLHIDLKLIQVELADDHIKSVVQYHGTNRNEKQDQPSIQQNAVWQVYWQWPSPEVLPRVERIELELSSFEEIATDRQLFVDFTTSVLNLEQDALLQRQLLTSQTHWTTRLEAAYGIDIGAFHGLAMGDVNGDGLEDVYVCLPGGLTNRLLVQNSNGTVTDRSAEAGLDFLDFTRHALLVDLDNDGDQDLAMLASAALLILENDGTGQFQRRSQYSLPSIAYSLSAADIDGDGLLDLHVTGRDAVQKDPRRSLLGDPVPYHDATNGGTDSMLRNLGMLRFANVTADVGLSDVRFSQAASWDDYDNDGDLDLYVANDFGRNALYQNQGGHFINVAGEAGVEDIAAGMSVSWGDYTNDGLMDLYVSNMFSAAGNRVAYQRFFKHDANQTIRAQYQRHARGNSLFANMGHGVFRDTSIEAGVTMGRWAWSSTFCDLNNDSWQDIIVANGFVTNDQTDDL